MAAVAGVHPHLDHGHLSAHDLLGGDVPDVHDIYKLVHLLDHLLSVRVGVHDERHTGETSRLGVADGQAFDVEAALPPLRDDAVEHAGTVFNQRYYRVRPDLVSLAHAVTSTRSSS